MKLSKKLTSFILGMCLAASLTLPSFTSKATTVTDTAGDTGEEEITGEEENPSLFLPIETNDIPGWPQGMAVNADAALVMDASTGTVLYSKNANAKEYPASITKVLAVLVALENCSLDETVTFSHDAVYTIPRGSSHIARQEGEQLTVEQCLYAMMLESANECANAIAEHVAGSNAAFAELMNAKAAELGCTGSHFVNPHGLHDENHYTTAHDMALITEAALKNKTFTEIAGTVRYAIGPTNMNPEELMMNNHHAMISKHRTLKFYDESVYAGKTGYTTDALNTLITCANRNGMNLICILLRSPSGTAYPDTQALLDYATDNFSVAQIPTDPSNFAPDALEAIRKADPKFDLANAAVMEGTDTSVILPAGVIFEALTPAAEVQTAEDGTAVLYLDYTYENEVLGTLRLVSGTDTAATTPSSGSGDETSGSSSDASSDVPKKETSSNTLFRIILVVIVLLAVVFGITLIVFFTYQSKQKKRRKRARMDARRKRREAEKAELARYGIERRNESVDEDTY